MRLSRMYSRFQMRLSKCIRSVIPPFNWHGDGRLLAGWMNEKWRPKESAKRWMDAWLNEMHMIYTLRKNRYLSSHSVYKYYSLRCNWPGYHLQRIAHDLFIKILWMHLPQFRTDGYVLVTIRFAHIKPSSLRTESTVTLNRQEKKMTIKNKSSASHCETTPCFVLVLPDRNSAPATSASIAGSPLDSWRLGTFYFYPSGAVSRLTTIFDCRQGIKQTKVSLSPSTPPPLSRSLSLSRNRMVS